MFRDFTLNGHWWIPNNPDGAAYGALSYSADRIKLQLDRAITPELNAAYGVGSPKIPIILGRTNNSADVTVLGAFYWNSHGREIDLLANEVVVGAHLNDSTLSAVREAVVGFSNLEEWTGRQLVQQAVDNDQRAHFLVAKDLKPDLQVSDLPSLKRLTLSTDIRVLHDLAETRMTNQSRFIMEFEHLATLRTVTDSVRSLSNLLTLLMDEPVQPTRIRLTMQLAHAGPDVSANYASPARSALPKKRREFEMLLPFDDLSQSKTAEALFSNWFQKEQILRPVYDLLLSAIHSRGQYAQSTFLSLAQALESFHRKIYEGEYISKSEYSIIKKALVNAIPVGIDAKLSDKLKSMLHFGNELSLKSRLEYLFAGIRRDHLDNLAGTDDCAQFIRSLADIRNYLTHHEGKKPSILESPVAMYNLNRRVAALLMILLFKYMGVPENLIYLPVVAHLRLF